MTAEHDRLEATRTQELPWKKWGPTGAIARIMHLFATLTPEQVLESGKKVYFETPSRAATFEPAGAR